ncbi:sigma-24 [Planctomycetota bacterium]|nr:sigma-24 [Planctomycetota bacterium]
MVTAGPDQADLDDAIRRVQAGDAEAFTLLVETYQRALRTWVARYCSPGIEADEIAHRAFIAGFQSIHRFTGGAFLPWLCAIARHELLGELKRQKRSRQRPHGTLAELAELERTSALADLEDAPAADQDQRRVMALRTCLAQVQGTAAQLLDRRYRLGEGLDAIAAGLGLSLDAVKSRLHWLRGKLHACVMARLASTAAESGTP